MLSLTLALMVAGGGEVAGWTAPKPRKVLIVDGEMRGEGIAERLTLLVDSVSGIDRETALNNIEIRARQLQKPGTWFYDIGDPQTQRELSAYICVAGIEFIILDNVTTLTDTLGDENSADAIKPVLTFLMDLKTTNVGVLLIHHSNKGGNSYRGSTALMTTFEVAMGLNKPQEAPMGQASFSLEFTKFRAKSNQLLAPRVFTLDGSKWHVSEDEGNEALRPVRAIQSGRFATQQDAGLSIGIQDKTKVSRLLAQAYAKGLAKQHEIKRVSRRLRRVLRKRSMTMRRFKPV
ncbi:AAA family ATPase [Belnapia sp. T18]|uniref:AAA family ATPase n=2 Tax=Belnapia arida TaxID=2804533 RepID=A0ABS1UC78_9PROT|nr:AAA family ATPase [Belnapia arida]